MHSLTNLSDSAVAFMQSLSVDFKSGSSILAYSSNPLISKCGEDMEGAFKPKANYDIRGHIDSVDYYTPDGDLLKQVCYDENDISKINYFHNGFLYMSVLFGSEDTVLSKKVYKKDGSIAHQIEYRYDKENRIACIHKKDKSDISVEYVYDCLGRIIERKISVDGHLRAWQHYTYDILNRITGYKDDNKTVAVSNISKKNELISYTITDTMKRKVCINNRFSETGEYINTEIISGNERSVIKDKNYVDNVMLKKPHTSEDDLDLIISSLFRTAETSVTRTDFKDVVNRNSAKLLDSGIKVQTLPISIRKRMLFNTLK